MIYTVIWVVLMMFWVLFGCYHTWEPARPAALGTTIIPWLCVLILGLAVFGAIDVRDVRRADLAHRGPDAARAGP